MRCARFDRRVEISDFVSHACRRRECMVLEACRFAVILINISAYSFVKRIGLL